MKILINLLSSILKEQIAFAHCDIPCGIYDPNNAQLAAHTILRMTMLLDSQKNDDPKIKLIHDVSRLTRVKEDHGNLLETELTTLKNDYFKNNHFEQFKNLSDLFNDTFVLNSKSRQTIDVQAAADLLESVLKIAEIFYQSKNVIPIRIKSVYPTEKEIVTYK